MTILIAPAAYAMLHQRMIRDSVDAASKNGQRIPFSNSRRFLCVQLCANKLDKRKQVHRNRNLLMLSFSVIGV
ncbi:hypothetical protein Ddye_007650 [Dipteronia dyeriana]|uniref:Uncharacterized protein n=1 Tax=Dipteronia dyeriana TaxID=168575 RepID=A0AAD9XKN6_9ROSI|nr:hypothetical protein Ddye_007650 [Dipteronia dyeriana]